MDEKLEPNVKCPDGSLPDDDHVLRINVGGCQFMTYRRTIQKHVGCRLADVGFLDDHFSESLGEYFFDRDPDMFRATLNYMRSGKLHIPTFICGPAAKTEMEFWGIAPNKIEQCCWMNYNEWNSTQEALKRLERDRKMNLSPGFNETSGSVSAWERLRPVVWTALNRSNSSFTAKVLGFISLIFVVLSIFSFLAETTKPFEHYIARFGEDDVPESANRTSYMSHNTSLPAGINSTSETTTMVLETTTDTYIKVKHPALYYIDLMCLIYFAFEYIMRLVFAPKKLKYVVSLIAVIDLLAILPDVIELLVYHINPALQADVDAVNYITILRVMRVLRIFRLVRHSPGLWILVYTLRASFSELVLLVWFVGIGILVFSSLIYYVESEEHFKSIPDGFWWALITMTTVGYGDMYPHTALGKIVGSVCAMSGVLMIGFTVPALVNNFMLYYRHVQFAVFVEENHTDTDADKADKASSGYSECTTPEKHGSFCSSEKKIQNGGSEEAPLMAKLQV